jgi:hypothetical protein
LIKICCHLRQNPFFISFWFFFSNKEKHKEIPNNKSPISLIWWLHTFSLQREREEEKRTVNALDN